jgi:hypothetical protein
MKQNPLVGKKILAVYLAEDGEAIRFDVEGGDPVVARVDADCCSHTWIEYIETPEHLLGTVQKVENIDLDKTEENTADGEYIQFYGCKITTERGSSLLDYRNSSNGYYGGSLVWPGEYFYGGVFNQNVSGEEWKQIA